VNFAGSATGSSVNGLSAPARVLIVDDSVVARTIITRMVESFDGFKVSATVSSVAAALDHLAHAIVDIILLDIEMPGIDGLTALPSLLEAGAGARILIVSTACEEGGAAAVRALALGAADTLVKPAAGNLANRFSEALHERLVRLTARPGHPTPSGSVTQIVPRADFDVVAIGASTGGIHALSQLLGALPPEFETPILITQHLPTSFMCYFAAQLEIIARRPCDVAIDHIRIRPGRIIIAPGDGHLLCVKVRDGGAIRLGREPAVSGCMPSVDPMLESVTRVYGERALAIVLSGMGRDGMHGARNLYEAGGTVLVQDRASSVVWGMPGAIATSGNATAVMTPVSMAAFLSASVSGA